MRKRQTFGWILFALGVFVLAINVLYDHQINLGPFEFVYHFLDWFSISAFFHLVFESFESVVEFIAEYFWCLFLIVIGIALIYGAKKQKQYDEERIYSSYEGMQEEKRKTKLICRNLDDMRLAGVCSGIAKMFEVDATIVRIIVLFLGFSSGGSLLFVYILLALLLPGEHLGR